MGKATEVDIKSLKLAEVLLGMFGGIEDIWLTKAHRDSASGSRIQEVKATPDKDFIEISLLAHGIIKCGLLQALIQTWDEVFMSHRRCNSAGANTTRL
ncbi:hypothetical protein CMQ_2445 [Grosmannia clavigera kw1407]|uniref:Uncharacterized protein n=1 Tax=Grosmannia clavigera (strain kw1407 / UAMH 11150) TaxID=655863 RepID=F0XIV8_GROCL|nr:uncharacterized protein CMQ_2445 [Grosmannia clavigera kw1407]EFX02396.1 hypothetical protein CMQ_2445 [Grosmannia clavigera kw1407]